MVEVRAGFLGRWLIIFGKMNSGERRTKNAQGGEEAGGGGAELPVTSFGPGDIVQIISASANATAASSLSFSSSSVGSASSSSQLSRDGSVMSGVVWRLTSHQISIAVDEYDPDDPLVEPVSLHMLANDVYVFLFPSFRRSYLRLVLLLLCVVVPAFVLSWLSFLMLLLLGSCCCFRFVLLLMAVSGFSFASLSVSLSSFFPSLF